MVCKASSAVGSINILGLVGWSMPSVCCVFPERECALVPQGVSGGAGLSGVGARGVEDREKGVGADKL